MFKCTKCGKQNSDTAKFCTDCGATLTASAVSTTHPPPPVIPSSNQSGVKRRWAVGSFLLIGVMAAVYFLFFKKTYKKEDESGEIETIQLKEQVNKWSTALSKKSLNNLAELYDDSLIYYQVKMSREGSLGIVSAFFSKNPDYFQQLVGEIEVEKIDNNNFKCSFVKKATLNGRTTDYPSYIRFRKQLGELKIIEEGDLVTDKNIARIAAGKKIQVNEGESYTDITGKLIYKGDCYVIITGSFVNETYARGYADSINKQGYQNIGYLWIPDYPSLSGKPFYATFIGPYQTYAACENNLRTLKKTGRFWYGIKVSYDSQRIEIR